MNAEPLDRDSWPVAILAGGLATRLRPISETVPKALINVAGEPFLAHQLRLLRRAGFRKVVLCIGHRGEMIQEQFGDGTNAGMTLTYSSDGAQLLGTGGALKKALPLLGDHFFVLYGDSYLPIDYSAPAQAFVASQKLGLMTVFRNEGRWDSSNVRFQGGLIKSYDKKQPAPEAKHIDYGLGLLRPEALDGYPDGKAFDLGDVYRDLISRDALAGYEVHERFYEIGSPKGLAELDAALRGQQLSATS
ncbi:MAG TPA: nucleotidyltransferase family protein [Chthoniobacterales bacterium]|nr:nucleotidyltransferase family protein [Chthoniobacterales bacterium]